MRLDGLSRLLALLLNSPIAYDSGVAAFSEFLSIIISIWPAERIIYRFHIIIVF